MYNISETSLIIFLRHNRRASNWIFLNIRKTRISWSIFNISPLKCWKRSDWRPSTIQKSQQSDFFSILIWSMTNIISATFFKKLNKNVRCEMWLPKHGRLWIIVLCAKIENFRDTACMPEAFYRWPYATILQRGKSNYYLRRIWHGTVSIRMELHLFRIRWKPIVQAGPRQSPAAFNSAVLNYYNARRTKHSSPEILC